MVDLSDEIAELWEALGSPGAAGARVIQVVAARRGEGASSVARALAAHACRSALRSVWLVDLDILAGAQFSALSGEEAHYGKLGPAASASPDGSMFFTLRPTALSAARTPIADAKYLSAHQVGDARWWVTRFQSERLQPGQNLHVIGDPAYWSTLRRHVDVIIVDCPSLDRSGAALTLAKNMDQTVIVVAADEVDVRPPAMLRDALVEAGASVSGLFVNRAGMAPALKQKSQRR
ncbi:MAG: sugar kinase [Alphaproteobacteria bacterium PA2]|nr:MAG: sugar kinase [Alphaproteobacteria bacterium PA2]